MSGPAATASLPRYGGNSVLRAVGYMCLASLFFPILNASVKYLGQRYPITEVFFARYLGHCVICLAIFLPQFNKDPATGEIRGVGTGFVATELARALAARDRRRFLRRRQIRADQIFVDLGKLGLTA